MCPDPLTQVADRAILTVRGYENLALEGDMVDFSCSVGEAITGSNTLVCTRNGKWEPDPQKISCDNINVMTTIIPNLQQFQIMNILVGSLLGVILLLITVTTIIVAFLVKGRIKGR